MTTTIQSRIGSLINALIDVRNDTSVAQERIDLQEVIDALFTLWQRDILNQLDRNAKDYKDAVRSLEEAEEEARAALKDLGNVFKAVRAATSAAKAVDRVVDFAIRLLA